MKNNFLLTSLLCLFFISYLAGCGSSGNTEDRSDTSEKETESETHIESTESSGSIAILNTAKFEQDNEMYSPEIDSTYLYWLDSSLIVLNGSTKCNIFALNVLKISGYKTPDVNALARDLFDTAEFRDILPVVGINDISKAAKGDLVVWPWHVIIFESETEINNEMYANGFWAGTRQEDNGENIKNNVCHGKYKLDGEFIVRRPLKK